MWARIDDTGRCAEFTATDPAERFHPSLRWEPVAVAIQDWADSAYVALVGGGVAPPATDYIRDQAKSRVAARRYTAEIGGVTLPNGVVLRTDRESQAMIGNAVALAQLEPEAPVAFKAVSGWVTLTGAQMQAIGRAVGAHVRACFAREQAIGALIDVAETWQEVVAVYQAQVDAGWPGGSS